MTWNPREHPFVAMPVGGIGTGSLAMGSDGAWRQIQLHGLGHHRGDLPGTFLALRIMQHVPPYDHTAILQSTRGDPGARGHPATPMVDDDLVPAWQRELLEAVPGTRTTMTATYPVAEVQHRLDGPVDVRVRAFSPLVPGDLETSGLPVAMVEVELTNTSESVARTWLAHSVHNPVGLDPHLNPQGIRAPGYGGNTNRLRRIDREHAQLICENPSVDPASPHAGQLVLQCHASDVIALPCFEEPLELIDYLRLLAPWGDHTRACVAPWIQTPQNSAPSPRHGPSSAGRTWLGALVGFTELQPGETATLRFALSWWFPNRVVDFVQFGPDRPEHGATQFWLGNHYARIWPDALSVAEHVATEWEALREGTMRWVASMEQLPLPSRWRQHLAAQPVALRTPTSFRTADGTCFGFEGVLGASTRMWSGDIGGSCPLNCTHVWNYAMAAAAIFPAWEASMRATEFDVMQAPSGALPHRVYVPTYLRQLGEGPIGGPDWPALDGMCGAVLKTYRELRRGAVDLAWVEQRWGGIVALMEHIQRTWDPEETGLLHGIQPSTHDIGLHGANTFMGTWWLAALRAAEELALLLGANERAERWRERFEAGSGRYDETCFAEGYYVQVPDPDHSLEHQWGAGCLSDQLIGQWWAHQLDLGYLLPEDHVREALGNVVRHNLRQDPVADGQRRFAVAGEQGLVMCSWPSGGRPDVPTMYCDEVWTGVEYQVAAHCFHEGLRDEGALVMEALLHRHDGRRRNPFNEVECGDHYARAMAGWSVVEAALGLAWNQLDGELRVGVEGRIPVLTGSGWGEAEVGVDSVRLRCHRGEIPLRRVTTPSASFHSPGVVRPGEWVELRKAAQ